MSTVKQATNKTSKDHRASPTDTAHRSQRDDPAEDGNISEGRLPKTRTGSGDTHGKGVDEVGRDSRAPHNRG